MSYEVERFAREQAGVGLKTTRHVVRISRRGDTTRPWLIVSWVEVAGDARLLGMKFFSPSRDGAICEKMVASMLNTRMLAGADIRRSFETCQSIEEVFEVFPRSVATKITQGQLDVIGATLPATFQDASLEGLAASVAKGATMEQIRQEEKRAIENELKSNPIFGIF